MNHKLGIALVPLLVQYTSLTLHNRYINSHDKTASWDNKTDNSPVIHCGLTNSVADSLIKRFKLCVPFVYGSVLFHSFRPGNVFRMLIKIRGFIRTN